MGGHGLTGVRAPYPPLLESADRIDDYISRLYCRFIQLRWFNTLATHQVENSSAATEEIISNDPPVASPPDGF